MTSSGGDEALEREELETLVRRQVDGLIIAPADGRRNTAESFVSAGIPVVTFDRPFSGTEIDSITVTNRDAVRESTEHSLSHGYRSILAIGARPHLYTGAERAAGYISTMKRAQLKKQTCLVDHESKLTDDVVRSLVKGGGEKVEAILTLNGITTMAILRALRNLGVQVGRDIALISFDDFDLAEIVTPSLTVVRQPAAELGQRAAELRFARMEGGAHLPRHRRQTDRMAQLPSLAGNEPALHGRRSQGRAGTPASREQQDYVRHLHPCSLRTEARSERESRRVAARRRRRKAIAPYSTLKLLLARSLVSLNY